MQPNLDANGYDKIHTFCIRGEYKQMDQELKRFLLRHNDHLKEIKLMEFNYIFKRDFSDLLQILIPLPPEKYELKNRLSTEITNKMRKEMKRWEIEKLENEIQKEIDLKYNTFDENELTFDENDNNNSNINNKNSKNWHSCIEMLTFDELVASLHDNGWEEIVKRELTTKRIKTGLAKLKCLVNSAMYDSQYLDSIIIKHILDNIGNQLLSLHINDCFRDFEIQNAFEMATNYLNDPCTITSTQKFSKKNWFPQKLQHLCLRSEDRKRQYLWHKVTKFTFPALKHLTILQYFERNATFINSNRFIDHFASLIKNGLKSLSFDIRSVGLNHIYIDRNFVKLSKILLVDFFNQFRRIFKNISSKQDEFILKIAINIVDNSIDKFRYISDFVKHCKREKKFTAIFDTLALMYLSMSQCFSNVMLACKFSIGIDSNKSQKWAECIHDEIAKALNEEWLFSRDETKCVNYCECMSTSLKKLDFAFVVKSKHFQVCHMDPKHEFECSRCESKPWLDV